MKWVKLVHSLTFCLFTKQAKQVSIFAGVSSVFKIFIFSVIQKDQEKLVIAHYEQSIEKTILINGKWFDILKKSRSYTNLWNSHHLRILPFVSNNLFQHS